MRKITCLSILCIAVVNSFAQKDTFDLIAYTTPKDSTGASWQKEAKENTTSYTITNKITNSWCRIIIVKSTISKGSIEQDFESEWQGLIVKSYKPKEAPQLNEVMELEGWKIKTGGANFNFNNTKAMVLLTTASGYNRCVSIVAVTNNQDYIKDIDVLLSSVDLKKPDTNTLQSAVNNDDKNSVTGTWGSSSSDQSSFRVNNGVMNYISRQYTFNADGSYTFISKTFDPLMTNIILGKENGTYQISGNNITVNPEKSVLEAWSKKNGSDKWGKLINSQSAPIEKTIYQFTKHYFSGIQIWNLVLQANKETARDGNFSSNDAFSNAWYYAPIATNNPVIILPD